MGHYFSEMDPVGANKAHETAKRIRSLREKLKDVPLGEFTVSELESVMRLMGLYENWSMRDSDFELLEKKPLKKP